MSAAVLALSTLLVIGRVAEADAAEREAPGDLDALAVIALELHPEVLALGFDAGAAQDRARAAGRVMDPEWMLGVRALGAMPGSMDPMMGMVGVQQMFGLPVVYTASRERAALDEQWARAEGLRVAADVRAALWETAARLRAQTVQGQALDEQLRAAEAALQFGRARYGAGAGPASPGAVSPGGKMEPEGAPVATPIVTAPTSGGGMSGMAGGGGSGRGRGNDMGAMPGASGMPGMPEVGGMGEMGAMAGGMAGPMGGGGLAALLRLEAEVARARADRDALAARRAGEEARLALVVGDEAARAVAASPGRYLGPHEPLGERVEGSGAPERGLVATSIAMAAADVRIARAERLPTFMVEAGVQVMPEGPDGAGWMLNGVDATLGLTVPIWGGSRARVEAAVASAGAAARRGDLVDRGLADAIALARADLAAAVARQEALTQVAAPRARAAWNATIAVWRAGGGTAADLVAAWQTEVAVARDAADAELAAELALARLSRLEGR